MPFLHDLAASQLRSWLATQEDVSAFQVHTANAPQCPERITSLILLTLLCCTQS